MCIVKRFPIQLHFGLQHESSPSPIMHRISKPTLEEQWKTTINGDGLHFDLIRLDWILGMDWKLTLVT
jgi:hypothetical protein